MGSTGKENWLSWRSAGRRLVGNLLNSGDMLALQETTGEKKMATVIYEDMESGDYGSFLGQKDRLKTPTTTPRDCYRKWFMLAMLSVLTAVNQGICYSYAPIAGIVEKRWEERVHSTELITVYFISYIPCSFVGSWIMDKKGLRYGVLLGGLLQALGAGLRYFACAFSPVGEAYVTLLGQILASFAMPFMVNSPAVLSANWFPPSMRATSTSVAINANAMGTAFVYLTAPFIVLSSNEVPYWNLYLALVAAASWVVAFFFFRSYPRTGVAQSIVSDVQLRDEYDWAQWATAFTHTGFWHTVVAFSVAECILNAMCALLGKFLSVAHFSKSQIGIVGAAFIVSSLIGGQVISQYVDKKRNHKTALQLCLLLTSIAIASFRLVPKVNVHATLVSLMFLGAVLGPLQPIVLELGVECAYPTSEATVAALQQLCGNFLSAIVVPGLSALRRTHVDATGHVPPKFFFASPEWIMVFMTTATFVVFCFFDGTYKRFAHESKKTNARSNNEHILITRTSRDTGSFF